MGNQFNSTSILEIIQEEKNGLPVTEKQINIDNGSIVIKNGFGSCKACQCMGYKANDPKNDYCRSCGHHWTQHR